MLTLKIAVVKMSKRKCDQAQCFYNCPSNKVPWMPEVFSLTSGEKRAQRSCTGRPEAALAQAVIKSFECADPITLGNSLED